MISTAQSRDREGVAISFEFYAMVLHFSLYIFRFLLSAKRCTLFLKSLAFSLPFRYPIPT